MYPNILSAFYSQPLALLPEKLEEIRAFLEIKAAGGQVAEERVREIMAARRPDGVQMAGRTALVQVFGVISQRVGGLERASGGVSTEELGVTLETLVADKGVRNICMVFDSPGGSVFGVEELVRKIAGLKAEKRIVAQADSVAASAAYWLASQCSEICVTPGGQVGSIGVIAAHQDRSRREDAKGVKTTLVTSSKYKGEGSPEMPLDDDARAEMQAKVDHYHALFTAAVARGRGTTEARVNADMGQGRMSTAKQAVERGMADKIATLEQTLARMGAFDGGSKAMGAGLASARARMANVEG